MNVDKTHPGVKQMLEDGVLYIRRTSKSFSRAAVDITLEQTGNADAASRKTGIAAFGCDSTRRRWMLTRSVRSVIVGKLLAKAGLKSPDDVMKELKPYRIKKDTEDLHTIIEGIESQINPFQLEADANLYQCIASLQEKMWPTTSNMNYWHSLREVNNGVMCFWRDALLILSVSRSQFQGVRWKTSLLLQ